MTLIQRLQTVIEFADEWGDSRSEIDKAMIECIEALQKVSYHDMDCMKEFTEDRSCWCPGFHAAKALLSIEAAVAKAEGK